MLIMTDTSSWSNTLRQKFDGIEPFGNFVASRECEHYPRTYPRLKVEDSRIGLPLDPMVAESLRDKAQAAPFGRKDKTVYDDSVRKAYQFEPSQVALGGDVWDDYIKDSVVPTIAYDLGYSRDQTSKHITANLYKVLLYDEGGHFMPHRDTAKEDGMFATMVIQLPSAYEGGATTVTHNGEIQTVDLAEDSANKMHVTAFFADCLHQLHPVRSGWRLVLVYNLVMTQKTEIPVSVSEKNLAAFSDLMELCDVWFKSTEPGSSGQRRRRMGYKLSHKYSPSEFSWNALRGRDDVLAHSLKVVSDRLGKPIFRIRLVLLEQIKKCNCVGDVIEINAGTRMVVDSDGSKIFDLHNEWSSDWQLNLQDDGWLIQSNYMATSEDDPVFSDHGYEGYEEEETGNEGTIETFWYYSACILVEPARSPAK